MNLAEIRSLSLKKLVEALKKARRELAVSRFHLQTGQARDTSKPRKSRRQIARILTAIHEKQTQEKAEPTKEKTTHKPTNQSSN